MTSASGMEIDVDVECKDGTHKIRFDLGFISRIEAGISATDVEPIKGFFQVRAYKANTREDLNEKIMKDETGELRRELRKLGAPEKLVSNAHAPRPISNSIVILPKLDKISTPKTKKGKKMKLTYIENIDESKRGFLQGKSIIK